MIIDVHAYLGHYAFRRLRHNTADGLLKVMDSREIDRSIVASASAITYRNPQAGNEEVHSEVGPHRDRLIPFAVINPSYAGWQDDLRICRDDFGMLGIRLHPNWHNYRLADAACRDLVRKVTELGMVVAIAIRVEDPRERSWLANVPDVPLEDVVELVRDFPKGRFLILGGSAFHRSALGRKDSGLPTNYRIEISRLTALIDSEIGGLVRDIGVERLVLGTGMPFSYPDPALLKLKVLGLDPAQGEAIAWRNAATWLAANR